MNYLLVTDNATGARQFMCFEEAARLTKTVAEEIEAALDEFNVCVSIDYTISDTRMAEDII